MLGWMRRNISRQRKRLAINEVEKGISQKNIWDQDEEIKDL